MIATPQAAFDRTALANLALNVDAHFDDLTALVQALIYSIEEIETIIAPERHKPLQQWIGVKAFTAGRLAMLAHGIVVKGKTEAVEVIERIDKL